MLEEKNESLKGLKDFNFVGKGCLDSAKKYKV